MAKRARYPSDLTDAQFARIEPLLPKRRCGGVNGGRPARPWREIVNAILYINRSGAGWRHMPHDLVKWQTAYHYFNLWTKDGTWKAVHEALRAQVRKAHGRKVSPSAAIIDSQSVKSTQKKGACADTTPARRSRESSAICSSTRSASSCRRG